MIVSSGTLIAQPEELDFRLRLLTLSFSRGDEKLSDAEVLEFTVAILSSALMQHADLPEKRA